MATSASLLERMRRRAQRVKTEHSGVAYPRWDLSGKKATIAKGASGILRLLPRWDIANKYVVKNGKLVTNPKYVEDMIYSEAREHWYTRAKDQQRLPAICLKTYDPKTRCPLCELASELRETGSVEDSEDARELEAKELFLYNAVKGRTGARQLTDAGLVDIRVLPLWGSLYCQVTEMMTGGDSEDTEGSESFRCDDLSDETAGYDLRFTRPADKTERWKIVAARAPSPLFTADDKAAFKGWRQRLIDIPKALLTQQQSYEALYESATGEKPPKAATVSGKPSAKRRAVEEEDEVEVDEEETDEVLEEDEEVDEVLEEDEEVDEVLEEDEEETDEEEEPAPVRKGKTKASVPEEDDEAFGFTMPGDEEEEPPKKKSVAAPVAKKKPLALVKKKKR